jgi:uncharacterized membrane protein YfcA
VTPSPEALALLVLAAGFAGFVDAVVGGGGLVQLPALVLGLPGAAPVQVLATNKLASFCGTTVASATYYRRVRPHAGTFVPLMAFAFLGSLGGAVLASRIPASAFTPLVLVVLLAVGAYVVLRPAIGERTELRFSGHRHTAAAMTAGLVIGAYDGALGPGTGSCFVLPVGGVLGYAFLEASAKARMANWATNLAALCVFVPQDAVLWRTGLLMGAANLAGGYLGARTAVARGAGFIRMAFLAVVAAFVVRLGGDVLGFWG